MFNRSQYLTAPLFVMMCVLPLLSGCGILAKLPIIGSESKEIEMMYNDGKYDEALAKAAERLKKEPTDQKVRDLLPLCYGASQKAHLANVQTFKALTHRFRWDLVSGEYRQLVENNNLVRNLDVKLKRTEYTAPYAEASEKAAAAHYQAGVEIAKTAEERSDHRNAARQFAHAKDFKSDYRDVQAQYEKSKQAGMRNIAIIPFDDTSGRAYGDIGTTITDRVTSVLSGDQRVTEFLHLVGRGMLMDKVADELQINLSGIIDDSTAAKIGKGLGAQEIIVGQITHVAYNPPQLTTKTYKSEKKVKEKRGESEVEFTVTADVTRHRRQSSINIVGAYRVVDVETTQLLTTKPFGAVEEFDDEWQTFVGDERAAPYTKEPEPVPTAEQMLLVAKDKLIGGIVDKLRVYMVTDDPMLFTIDSKHRKKLNDNKIDELQTVFEVEGISLSPYSRATTEIENEWWMLVSADSTFTIWHELNQYEEKGEIKTKGELNVYGDVKSQSDTNSKSTPLGGNSTALGGQQ